MRWERVRSALVIKQQDTAATSHPLVDSKVVIVQVRYPGVSGDVAIDWLCRWQWRRTASRDQIWCKRWSTVTRSVPQLPLSSLVVMLPVINLECLLSAV